MARYERDGREVPASPQVKVKLRRREDGSLEIAPGPKPETVAETARDEGAPLADDVRSSIDRNLPHAWGAS